MVSLCFVPLSTFECPLCDCITIIISILSVCGGRGLQLRNQCFGTTTSDPSTGYLAVSIAIVTKCTDTQEPTWLPALLVLVQCTCRST